MKNWDTVYIFDVFWGILMIQFCFELLTYLGIFKWLGLNPNKKFVYNKPKEKSEDIFYDSMVEEPWNVDEVKLNLARSLSHLMLNHMMLLIAVLMRPHNVVMVPSVYFTCVLTSKCMDHKLLDRRPERKTDSADVLSQTLVHLWIGTVFFFYQVQCLYWH